MERAMLITKRYLNLPVKADAPRQWLRVIVDGKPVSEFEINLAEGEPDFWSFIDVLSYRGRKLELQRMGGPEPALPVPVEQFDEIKGAETIYREKYRPQFHFSTRRGWINDPNGLVFYAGEYHLFYQHYAFGWSWGTKSWGHAVSTDLVHWAELPEALSPDHLGDIWSGSAAVDWRNTAGFQRGQEKTIVAIYTAGGDQTPASKGLPATQAIAYSTDRGRTWTKYSGNPVVGHIAGYNRDPKVVWHDPTERWVMALYLDKEGDFQRHALLTSPDLKCWQMRSEVRLPGTGECPDFFELPVDGDQANRKWVFWQADGHHMIGSFDGRTFTPESEPRLAYVGDAYAAQTYSDIPESDGRRIQIAWLRGDLPGMPFNQQMSFPIELTLRTTRAGVRLFAYPVQEIEALRVGTSRCGDLALGLGEPQLVAEGELLDINALFDVGAAARVGLVVRGVPITYDVEARTLSCGHYAAALYPEAGRIWVRVLVDRASVEVFANDGLVSMPVGIILPEHDRSVKAFAEGGHALLEQLVVHELRSAWL